MQEIPLTKGYVAIVDDDDYEKVAAFKWCAHVDSKNGKVYAYRNSRSVPNCMHRFIMGETNPKILIDHKNGNGIDNQRHNLRRANSSRNNANTGKYKINKSGYKGVHWDKVEKQWVAQITADRKKTFIGRFSEKEDAAKAYDALAFKIFGPFAVLNFLQTEAI